MSASRAEVLSSWLLALALLGGCQDPFKFNAESQELEDCAASSDWLGPGGTPALPQFNPLPHPTSECPFYRGGWQNFLVAMQPDPAGRPAILDYPTIETVFTSAKPRSPNR